MMITCVVRYRIDVSRLGEELHWAAPATADTSKEDRRALRDACGTGEIYVVGSPEANERFLAQHPLAR